MASKQKEQPQQSTQADPLKHAREAYKHHSDQLSELRRQREDATDLEEETRNEQAKAIEKERNRSKRAKDKYEGLVDERTKVLAARSDAASKSELEALNSEMKELEEFYQHKFDLEKGLDRLNKRMAELERQINEEPDAEAKKKLKSTLRTTKYRKSCVENEQKAEGNLKVLQEELKSFKRDKKITSGNRQRAEEKAAKDLADAKKKLDELNVFLSRSNEFKGYLTDPEKKTGKKAVLETPEELWKVLPGFEGRDKAEIRKKTAEALKIKENKQNALAAQTLLHDLGKLEHQIEDARKSYEDAVFQRKKAYNYETRLRKMAAEGRKSDD